jgi:hypothetical protein
MAATPNSSRAAFSSPARTSRFERTNSLARRLGRLSDEREIERWREGLVSLLDNWLFWLEEMTYDGRSAAGRRQWHQLRELVRIYDPDESRDTVPTAVAVEIVYTMLGLLMAGTEEEEEEPCGTGTP